MIRGKNPQVDAHLLFILSLLTADEDEDDQTPPAAVAPKKQMAAPRQTISKPPPFRKEVEEFEEEDDELSPSRTAVVAGVNENKSQIEVSAEQSRIEERLKRA